jgi:4-amino-4-deoxy-L-arabinose transferase-like glycosyltransferase
MDQSLATDSLHSNVPLAIQSVSLVVVCDDWSTTDERIWNVVRELGRVRCRAQVCIVDPCLQAGEHRLTYRPVPKIYLSIALALADAKHERIVILDRDAELTRHQWATLIAQPTETVRAIFQTEKPASRASRWLVWLYSIFTLLFLKTRKHEFTRGAVILPANLVLKNITRLAGPPRHDVTRLMSLTAWHNRQRVESVCHISDRQTVPTSSGRVRSGFGRVGSAFGRAIRFWYAVLMFPRRHAEIVERKPKQKNKRYLISLLLMLVAGLLLFGNLDYPLFEPDETRNAELALALIESKDWSVLKLHQSYYWDKPPLQIWSIASSYKLLGPSPWSTRLPIALASMLTIGLTFFLGRRLIGFYAAVAATVMLLSSIGFVIISRYTNMDATLTAMTTAMFLFGYESVRGGFRRGKSLLAGVAAGLGLMVKGPIIIVLCGPPLMLAYWLEGNRESEQAVARKRRARIGSKRIGAWQSNGFFKLGGSLKHLRLWVFDLFPPAALSWFVVPAVLVAGPWFVITAYHYPDFANQFFWKHNVVRFSEGFNHAGPSYYYLVGIFLFMFPTSYLIPSAVRYATSTKIDHVNARSREVGFLFLAIVWIFLFFTVSSTKLPTYVLPAFPLICLLIGAMVEQWIFVTQVKQNSLLQQLIRRAPFEMPIWGLVIAVVGVVWMQIPLKWAVVVVALCLAGGVGVFLGRMHRQPRRARRVAWCAVASVTLGLAAAVGQLYVPMIAGNRSDLIAVQRLMTEQDASRPIVFVGRDPHAAKQWLDRTVFYFDKEQIDEAAAFLQEKAGAVLIVSDDRVAELAGVAGDSIEFNKADWGRHVYLSSTNEKTAVSVSATRSAKAATDQRRR